MFYAKCVHLNIPAVILILIGIIMNGIRLSDTGKFGRVAERKASQFQTKYILFLLIIIFNLFLFISRQQ